MPEWSVANSRTVHEPADALHRPDGIAVLGDALFVTDKAAHCVCTYDAATLTRRAAFGSKGSANGQLRDPAGITILDGELIVADFSNHRLACFTPAGAPTRIIGRRGASPGCFYLPSGVGSARGFIVVAELRRLQVLTAAGVPQQVIVPPVCGSLYGLCASDDDRLLVADYESQLVHEFLFIR
uniref:Peptidylamidoglycolate lyase n=1 Tax=Coccolithus braarudii TaxID=221442 RepID=A0A7S0PW34_9EUKA